MILRLMYNRMYKRQDIFKSKGAILTKSYQMHKYVNLYINLQ